MKRGRWGRLRSGRSGKSEGENGGTVRTERTLSGVAGGSGPSTAAAWVGAPKLESEAGPRAAREGEGFRLPAGGVEIKQPLGDGRAASSSETTCLEVQES